MYVITDLDVENLEPLLTCNFLLNWHWIGRVREKVQFVGWVSIHKSCLTKIGDVCRRQCVAATFKVNSKGCQMVYVLKPKIPNLGKFWRVFNWRCLYLYLMAIWSILRPFGLFYGHLVYFLPFDIIYGLMVGIFFPVLVCCTNKNLATLVKSLM
jgi:hypothetical protein